jgi:hypothetical protein
MRGIFFALSPQEFNFSTRLGQRSFLLQLRALSEG